MSDLDPENRPSRAPRPGSATSMWINWIGFAATVVAWYLCVYVAKLSYFKTAIITLVVFAAVVAAIEILTLKTPWRRTTGIDWDSDNPVNLNRVLYKTVGFYATLLIIGFVYWVVHQYHRDFFNNYWTAIRYVLPIVCLLQIPYFLFVDRRMVDPYDGYWVLGRRVLGFRDDINPQILRQHFLGWTVKGFFLPIMFVDYINLLSHTPISFHNFISFYDWAYNAIFTVDLMLVTVGYVLTLRIFDSHIRSTEPSMLGWTVAIMCYPPFWGGIYDNVLPYQDNMTWGAYFRHDNVGTVEPIFGMVIGTNLSAFLWGLAILFCAYVYVWASLAFGLRFSNLTHRGIITVGPYRWTKHPAYVFKNISWWLIAIPFINHAGMDVALRQCAMLATVNFIYFMRARTEERHLSHDPQYVEYALWMNTHSIFAPLGRMIPFLRYKEPRKIPGFSLKV